MNRISFLTRGYAFKGLLAVLQGVNIAQILKKKGGDTIFLLDYSH